MTISTRIRTPSDKTGESVQVFSTLSKILQDGGVIAYPTETVYGLGCVAFNEPAVDRVRSLKGIESGRPFILLIPSFEWLGKLAVCVEQAHTLSRKFWPGPLTLVLEAAEGAPGFLLGDGGTIAMRHSSHSFVEALLGELGQPVVSTSANPKGYPPASNSEEVAAYFDGHKSTIDVLVEDPDNQSGLASTVVSLVGGRVEVLREGSITERDLLENQ